MNSVVFVGRTTKDLQLKEVGEGKMMVPFSLAVNRNYKNANGEVEADFIPCIAWGKTAQNLVTYCGKGSLIGVSGRVVSRAYTNAQNERIYRTDIIAEDVRFLALKEPRLEKEKLLAEFEVPTDVPT